MQTQTKKTLSEIYSPNHIMVWEHNKQFYFFLFCVILRINNSTLSLGKFISSKKKKIAW